jgi:hypothetical protein
VFFFDPLDSNGKKERLLRRNSTKKEGNHEEDAIEYYTGNGGIVCMGADHAAATHE